MVFSMAEGMERKARPARAHVCMHMCVCPAVCLSVSLSVELVMKKGIKIPCFTVPCAFIFLSRDSASK